MIIHNYGCSYIYMVVPFSCYSRRASLLTHWHTNDPLSPLTIPQFVVEIILLWQLLHVANLMKLSTCHKVSFRAANQHTLKYGQSILLILDHNHLVQTTPTKVWTGNQLQKPILSLWLAGELPEETALACRQSQTWGETIPLHGQHLHLYTCTCTYTLNSDTCRCAQWL